MNCALLLILSLILIPFSDNEKFNDPIVVVSMEVNLEVVSGIQYVDSFSNQVEVFDSEQKYQIGFREFTIYYPAETEVITGNPTHNHQNSKICPLYFVTDIEKVDENTGVLRLHFLSTDNQNEQNRENNTKHVATIIYL